MNSKITFGKICEQLNTFLSKFSNSLGIDDEEDSGSRVHPYGPINIHSELGDIRQVVSAMKARCDQLKVSGNGAVQVLKSAVESQHQEELTTPLKTCLKSCVEKLRNATQDLTLKTVIQKLQAISEESCLRFDNGGQTGTDFFISSDMFYFEIKLNTSGGIIDVREQLHSGEPKSCKELVEILRNGDYEEFRTRLKRLADLYKIKVDTFMKSSKIFAALEALEKDIIKLSTTNIDGEKYSEPFENVKSGPVGYVSRRQGGHLMQLTYFVFPFDMLKRDPVKSESRIESPIFSRDLGLSVTIAVESSKICRLPISPLVTIDDVNRIRYDDLDNNNSDELPASFVMKLTKPLAMSASFLCEIHTILAQTSAADFVHSSQASLENLIIKQHLGLKSRDEWSRKQFLVDLPDQEHVYRMCPSDVSSNLGFVISRIPFRHPSQVPSIVKVLRRQAIYNALLVSCAGKRNTSRCKETSEYFNVKAINSNSIEVVFQHPLHTSMASVTFSVLEDNSVQTSINASSDAPEVCSSCYLDKVINRCLSIPITMRSLLRKAYSYVPSSESSQVPQAPVVEEASRPKQLKLLIPSLSLDNAGSVPLVSPGIYSASTLLTFSLSSGSPSNASFQFPVADLSATLPGGYTKPAFSSPKKPKDSPSKPSTPGTPKSRTFKLPKITLKRKRDGDEYEIDKEKSNFDVLEESEAQTIADSLSDDSKQAGPKHDGSASSTAELAKSRDATLTTGNMPIDLSVDSLPPNAISINSVGELEGLLGPGIDVSSLMGGSLSANFGITGSFPDGFNGIPNSGGGENQIEAFDLEAITSGGSHINFGVDDSLHGVSAAVIDPSMVVSSSSGLANTPVFDVHQSLIDIDSFIMGPIPDRGSGNQIQNDQSG